MIRKLFSIFQRTTSIEFTDEEGKQFSYPLKKDTSVLDTLLDRGHSIPNSCKAGVCQSCILQCSNPENLPRTSQNGLGPAERELGYFLSCSCKPNKSLHITNAENQSALHSARILSKTFVSDDIIQLKLEAPFEFKGGQFCNLYKDQDVCRSYSIASGDNSHELEFHIKRLQHGQFSRWAAESLQPGEEIQLQGPFGECFYINHEDARKRPLLLCGIGTGLAPLLGVIRTAIADKHSGGIKLVIGARNADNFYLSEDLQSLKQSYPALDIHWLANEPGQNPPENLEIADIYTFVKEHVNDLDSHIVYLCGAPSFVQKMKKQCYMSGASLSNIFSDIFQPAN